MLIPMANGRPQVLTDCCWLETSISCHLCFSTRLLKYIKLLLTEPILWQRVSEGEQDPSDNFFCSLLSDIASLLLYSFVRIESLGPAHTQGEGATQGQEHQEVGPIRSHLGGSLPTRRHTYKRYDQVLVITNERNSRNEDMPRRTEILWKKWHLIQLLKKGMPKEQKKKW